MTYYFLTASKEYSFDGINWLSAIAPFTTRSGNSVTFNPQNGHSAFTMFPAADSMNVDTVLRAPNYFTPVQLVTTIITVFPKANTVTGIGTDASLLTTGTVNDSLLSTNVTAQGNTFNGNSQLIKTTAAGKLPAIDGSLLTNLRPPTLYGVTGSNTNGAMTQAAATDALAGKQSSLSIINAKDFGVKGDNSQDEIPSLNAALAYAATLTNGGIVLLPPGILRIDSKLQWTPPINKIVGLVGAGSDLTIFSPTFTTGTAVIEVGSNTQTYQNEQQKIGGFSVNGGSLSYAFTDAVISLHSFGLSKFFDMVVYNFPTCLAYHIKSVMDDGYGNLWENVFGFDVQRFILVSGSDDGVWYCDEQTMINCRCRLTDSNVGYGIKLQYSRFSRIISPTLCYTSTTNGSTNTSSKLIIFCGSAGQQSYNNQVIGAELERAHDPIWSEDGASYNMVIGVSYPFCINQKPTANDLYGEGGGLYYGTVINNTGTAGFGGDPGVNGVVRIGDIIECAKRMEVTPSGVSSINVALAIPAGAMLLSYQQINYVAITGTSTAIKAQFNGGSTTITGSTITKGNYGHYETLLMPEITSASTNLTLSGVGGTITGDIVVIVRYRIVKPTF